MENMAMKRSAALATISNADLQISKPLGFSYVEFLTRLNSSRTHEFRPVRLVLETFWDMCSSSEAYGRNDTAIFHSLSIPFKVSLDLLFTDSHLHCQGASRDLNQVLRGPAQANIFTRVCVLSA